MKKLVLAAALTAAASTALCWLDLEDPVVEAAGCCRRSSKLRRRASCCLLFLLLASRTAWQQLQA